MVKNHDQLLISKENGCGINWIINAIKNFRLCCQWKMLPIKLSVAIDLSIAALLVQEDLLKVSAEAWHKSVRSDPSRDCSSLSH